uniref:DUF2330 domain-containing protein n=1 Tax=Pseudenhygromyxa salsuginis TaxID=442868 RepID=A0A3Q8I1W9_9BACT|nr:hypothetical protein [Pseudenhygromyxa salsuginis]
MPSLPLHALRLPALIAGAALALAAPLLVPTEAQACGGTFCDSGPQTMPVDQTGENILFRIGADTVEAHIQIQYDPDSGAEAFAWVIPVTAIPEFEVGSQLFFDALLAGSVPSYGNVQTADFCGDGGDDGMGGDPGANSTGGDEGGGEEPPPDGNPDVVYKNTVGSYDIVVLDGGTVEGVMQWLGDNGYQQDPASEPILGKYLEEGYLFVAMKLTNQAGVDELHPIVIRYSGTQPCVPIRLTQIAAVDDMEIRAFFLGDARVVPINYRHVEVNPLKIDWFNNAANYKEVISLAVDAESADGNAFVTEYAGPSAVVNTFSFYNPSWDATPFLDLGLSPVGLIDLLAQQGLLFCDLEWDVVCTTNHPLLQPLLDQFVPVPDGVDQVLFYDCMECYLDQIDMNAWDAMLFSQAFDERIVKPAIRARDLIDQNNYLTRMYTTISPNEMNDDPMFRANPTLPEVVAQRLSTQTLHCDGGTTVTIPDGRQVYFPPGEPLVWPDFQDEMPWAEDVDQEGMAEAAPLINLVDNTALIDALLDEWNHREIAGNDDTDPGADDNGNLASGCACAVDEGDPAGGIAFGLALLGLAGLIRRRR